MKLINKILYVILGIIILAIVFVLLYAFVPGFSEKLSGVTDKKPESVIIEIEDLPSPDEEDTSVNEVLDPNNTYVPTPVVPAVKDEEPKGENSAELIIPENSMIIGEDLKTSYIKPDDGKMQISEELLKKAGLSEILPNVIKIDNNEADIISSKLGMGNTGEDYVSDALFYPYYEMLNEKGKKLYRQIYSNACDLTQEFLLVEPCSEADMQKIFFAVTADHPELFWLNTAYTVKRKTIGNCISMSLDFNRTAKTIENSKKQFEERVRAIVYGCDFFKDDFAKEKYVHDELSRRIDYKRASEMNQSAYSALINGETVCAGYARAFQYVMQKLGIPCYYCAGMAGEKHAWNIIRIYDKFYNVDVTWDDANPTNYNYYNKSDKAYSTNHARRDLSVYLPACTDNTYSLEEEAVYRDMDDLTLSESNIYKELEPYYTFCKASIKEMGKGTHKFSCVIDGYDLLKKWNDGYESKAYEEAYMTKTMSDIGSKRLIMTIKIEKLKGDKYLIVHEYTAY